MFRRLLCQSGIALVLVCATTRPATAAWPHDPNNGNVAVCTFPSNQIGVQMAPDGAGGAILVWADSRAGGSYDIYAQRISAAGVPMWTAGGVALCTAALVQQYPRPVPDGAGGAIVCWEDYRGGTGSTDIYAQRVSANGTVLWTANGVALSTAAGGQDGTAIAADGAGGAVVAWEDYRSAAWPDIYAQRVNSAGATQWTANGIGVCTDANEQLDEAVVADGAGGAIIAWHDRRGGNYDIYAQRLNGSGVAQWAANGVSLCTAAGNQSDVVMVSDATGGAVLAWTDYRSGTDYDIYAQRVSPAGGTLWTANGVVVSAAAEHQAVPAIASDGAGGAVVCWQDWRSGSGTDIYLQRLGAGGAALWTANGVSACAAAGDQDLICMTSDASGAAIIAWRDDRNAVSDDLYAQRLSATGVLQWPANSVAVSTAAGDQYYPALVPDGAGGAIVGWVDVRSGTADIYAQRIERYGMLGNPEPVITRVRDLPNDQGGLVKVSWDASYLDADPVYGVVEYRVFRSAAGPLASETSLHRSVSVDSDVAAHDGSLLATASAAGTVYWEYVGTQVAEALPGYSRVVATTSDSVEAGNPRTWFMVEARAGTSVSSDRWTSAPDSGYSVDNLAPAMPAPFTGQYAAGTTTLHWEPGTEPDLAGYRLYRGSSVAFTPGPGNLVGALPDTGYADAAGAPFVYKLVAVDVHGNASPVATLVPSGTLGVEAGAPAALAFAAPSPNPARTAAMLRWTLSREGHVRLSVFDAAGRRVALLHDGRLPAGEHEATFTLRDDAGRELACGLYLLRLEAEGRVLVRRLATIR